MTPSAKLDGFLLLLTMLPTKIQLCCLPRVIFMFIAANEHVFAVVVTHVRRYLSTV
jgi:hypothetical protein